MNIGLSVARLRHRRRRVKSTTVLSVIMGLITLYSLIGCACLGSIAGASTTAAQKNQTSPWKPVWDSEFSGSAGGPPASNEWTAEIGGNGWGNQQLEYDTDNLNAYQDGQGNLVLEARKASTERLQCWYGQCQYTSARISTSGHFSFTYGRLEARIKIPYGQGLWPAFWLLGSNLATVGWPSCGEIDVMENIGSKEPSTIYGSAHSPGTSPDSYTLFTRRYTLPHGAFSDDFHVFALQWDSAHLYFYVDGMNYATLAKAALLNQQDWVFDHPFNIVLDVAVGGNWPGNPNATTVFPQRMYVSYVRLYQNQ